jgi:hypothetical protein
MNTAAYRAKFGYWDYCMGDPPRYLLERLSKEYLAQRRLAAGGRPMLHPRLGWRPIPRELAAESTCLLTGWMHAYARWSIAVDLAEHYLVEYEALLAAHPDDADAARYAHVARAAREEAPYKSRSIPSDSPEDVARQASREASSKGWQDFGNAERGLLWQRICATLLSARAATVRLCERSRPVAKSADAHGVPDRGRTDTIG